ncbi:MAG: efflux RND transporter periplasmic adaptor subunit [Limisphaerales bacterium]
MNKKQLTAIGLVLALGAGLILLTLKFVKPAASGPDAHGEHAGHGDEHGETVEKGPHGGRLLHDGEFAVEITIFEHGVPPQFRVYPFAKDQPLDPAQVQLTIELQRLGGRKDTIHFKPEGDYLAGDQKVYEPHSFDVTVTAEVGGRTHRWQYESYESRVELTPEAAQNSGVVVETVGPAKLRGTLKVNGRIRPNEEQMKHVVPRYPGVLKEVRKRLGDRVEKDEVLAVVESNESLQRYEVKSDLAGTIIEKHAAPGEFVKEGDAIYVVADLSTVWVDLNIYRKDAARVKAGQVVRIDGGEGLPKAEGQIAYLSPFGAENTQTLLARVVLPNPEGEWRPGLFVTGEIVFEEVQAPLAVKSGALQTFRDWTVVFVNEGNFYEPLVVETGRRDGEWTEIISGLKPGQRYVAKNSFVIKADILKSGASHDH